MTPGAYARLRRTWRPGDVVQLDLPVRPRLVVANPLVEETRNQVAVFRGPVLYCGESVDLPEGVAISDVHVPRDIRFTTIPGGKELNGTPLLQGEALAVSIAPWSRNPWNVEPLYQPVDRIRPLPIRLVPYQLWANRGASQRTVFMPIDW